MKTKDTRSPLPNNCEASLNEQLQTAKGQAQSQALLRIISQVLDASGGGEDCSLRISATKNKDAYVVTLYQDGAASYATALSWAGLQEAVAQLL